MLEDEAARFDGQATRSATMELDIDHFKAINDTHGRDAGDAAPKEPAGPPRRPQPGEARGFAPTPTVTWTTRTSASWT